MIKLRSDGTLDGTFGALGVSFPSLSDRVCSGTIGYELRVADLHVDPNGDILLAFSPDISRAPQDRDVRPDRTFVWPSQTGFGCFWDVFPEFRRNA
ncbi:hypothetical protein, partial [Pseudomarimonas arenosa]